MTRRLEIVLPKNHEIFSYPRGSRSAVAATFLDIGIKLSHLEDKLSSIEQKVETIKIVGISAETKNDESEEKAKIAHNIIKGFGIT